MDKCYKNNPFEAKFLPLQEQENKIPYPYVVYPVYCSGQNISV